MTLLQSANGFLSTLNLSVSELWEMFIFSVRDGFVQVSAFVAITVLLFGYLQYRTGGRLITLLENNRRLQPVAGALLGLTPGCGGAIIAMPLYVRGTISFGTVVATLAATAGDAAFVIIALAPEAALYAYGIAFVAAVLFGYTVDLWGLGISRVDHAVDQLSRPLTDGGFASNRTSASELAACDLTHETKDGPLATLSHGVHVVWWVVAVAGLVAGVLYLARGAPDVPMQFAP